MDILFKVNPVPFAKKEHYIEFGRSFVVGGRHLQDSFRIKKIKVFVIIAEKILSSARYEVIVFFHKNCLKRTISIQKIFPEQFPNQVLTHQIRFFYDPFSR